MCQQRAGHGGEREISYEFVDDGRADGVDKVYGELQQKHYEKERRHAFPFTGALRAEQCSYDR